MKVKTNGIMKRINELKTGELFQPSQEEDNYCIMLEREVWIGSNDYNAVSILTGKVYTFSPYQYVQVYPEAYLALS